MKPADIDPSEKVLRSKGLFNRKKIPIDTIVIIIVQRLPSLVDEIGIIAMSRKGIVVFVRETQTGWHWLVNELKLDERLVEGWYTKAEAGEYFILEQKISSKSA